MQLAEVESFLGSDGGDKVLKLEAELAAARLDLAEAESEKDELLMEVDQLKATANVSQGRQSPEQEMDEEDEEDEKEEEAQTEEEEDKEDDVDAAAKNATEENFAKNARGLKDGSSISTSTSSGSRAPKTTAVLLETNSGNNTARAPLSLLTNIR